MKLAIISHTNHYFDQSGSIVGWGPTVSELNHLSPHFETIYHIAVLHKLVETPASAIPYTSNNIKLVPLPVTGGKTLLAKLNIITAIPVVLSTIRKTLSEVDVFQFRGPTGIGVYVIPYLTWFSSKKGWFKYAGNWSQRNAPLAFAFQRWFLRHQSRKVTINGNWPGEPGHCISFENPCLTLDERNIGTKVIENKNYKAPFQFCFVGRLDDAKGVHLIVEALLNLKKTSPIGAMHFIGDGPKKEVYESTLEKCGVAAIFHGFLPRGEVFKVYKKCHFILLPSKSEGFPKVIAEAMNFGCIPIVSNVSSIGQYVQKSGYLIDPIDSRALTEAIVKATTDTVFLLQEKAKAGHTVTEKFTFEHYNNRVLSELLT
jgi:glycosyltransferase involved in cell wall biosynthesis